MSPLALTLVLAAGLVLALVLATVLHVRFWARRYQRPWSAPERLEVQAADGTRLVLHRWPAAVGGEAGGAPLLLCHGVTCNARTFAVDEEQPMAALLAARGFDVYALDLRGAGESERGPPTARGYLAYVGLDAPAALDAVRAHSGRDRVLWVGHSMGGLIGYELVANPETRSKIAALATLGSPIRAAHVPPELVVGAAAFALLRPLLSRVHVPVSLFGRLVLPLAGRVRGWPESFFGRASNVSPVTLRRFVAQVVGPVHGAVLDELVSRVRHEVRGTGGPVAQVRSQVRESGVPVWVCAGRFDRIAPPRACTLVRPTAETPLPLDLLAERGHIDLVMGRNLEAEVLDPLVAWLLPHTARCETPAP
jgi:pimeloyl-ACP methyl ester carboxylesterase